MSRARTTTGQPRGGLERAKFLAALSHELRTPLNSILGFTHVLLSGLDGPLTQGQREDLEAIASAGEYLSALVREVLDTSAETTGELEVFGPVDLDPIVEDAARLFAPQVKKTQHQIMLTRSEPMPRPFGSPRAVRQVLLNLIGNAAKHGKPGPVQVSVFARGDVAGLAVTNLGRSVLTAREAPFRPFERGAEGRADPEGWGLGLAIADELAARMGGVIEMQSGETARGPVTTFALLLPLVRSARLREIPNTHTMPTRTHFVAAMSHELRAPLGSIAGFASLLEDEIEGPLTAVQKQSVTRIRRSAESLVSSLTDILDVARADVGRLQLALGDTQPRAVANDVLAGAERLVADREPPCSLALDEVSLETLGVVSIDARRVVQASLGLVRHALRASSTTELRIVVRALDHDVPSHERQLRVEVHDPSRTTDPQEAEATFDPFFALVDASGRRILGLGLAPALARTIARLHGGDAWCETSRGTTWVLSIPTP
ncbi:MAG: sensor histidine kinase [Deltaproteobacteria bacterium]